MIGFSEEERARAASESLFIYRVYSFERFIDILRKGCVSFVKPRLWEDPYENPLNREIIEEDTGHHLRMPTFEDDLYCQCWSLCPESDALWRIYSPDRRGVMVKARLDKLIPELHAPFGRKTELLYVGKVLYRTEAELKELFESEAFLHRVLRSKARSGDTASVLLYKRDAFSHEQEVRLILDRHISTDPMDSVELKVDANLAFDQLALDPRLSQEEYDRQEFTIRRSGYAGAIEKSQLYGTPSWTLKIPSLEAMYETDV